MNIYEDGGEKRLQEHEAMPYDTLVVNLFGGPGAGKSTLAHRLCADLAMRGRLIEYSPEYAKEIIWEGRRDMLDGSVVSQAVVASEQINRLNRLIGRVEIAVTDSPVLLEVPYVDGNDRSCASFVESLAAYHRSLRRLDVLVNRGSSYDTRGRKHTLDESMALDGAIRVLLEDAGEGFFEYFRDDSDQANYASLLASILKMTAE